MDNIKKVFKFNHAINTLLMYIGVGNNCISGLQTIDLISTWIYASAYTTGLKTRNSPMVLSITCNSSLPPNIQQYSFHEM